MSRRLKREFYLLPRGEQRALILLSFLLILFLVFRLLLQHLPDREPEGLKEFEQEGRQLMAAIARADSLRTAGRNSAGEDPAGRDGPAPVSLQAQKQIPAAYAININRADSVQLLPLPGIGPVYAGRIIKYRKLLGGFVSVDQLGEVYGIPEETLRNIRNKVVIDSSVVRKLRMDSASFIELLRHPYLEFEDVKSLADYREFKGSIHSVRELEDNNILPDSVLKKIRPYLEFINSEAVEFPE